MKKPRRGRKKRRGTRPDRTAGDDNEDEVMGANNDDSVAIDDLTQVEAVLWVGEKGRRLLRAADAQAAGAGCLADGSNDYLTSSSADSGRPPKRLTFAERRALDMENQELERGLLLWPDADMVEERNVSPRSTARYTGSIDWRAKRAAAIRRKASGSFV